MFSQHSCAPSSLASPGDDARETFDALFSGCLNTFLARKCLCGRMPNSKIVRIELPCRRARGDVATLLANRDW